MTLLHGYFGSDALARSYDRDSLFASDRGLALTGPAFDRSAHLDFVSPPRAGVNVTGLPLGVTHGSLAASPSMFTAWSARGSVFAIDDALGLSRPVDSVHGAPTVTTMTSSLTNALVNGLGGTADFGENVLAVGDEVQALVNLDTIFGPSGIDFFGTTYHNITVDNNGIVYFSTNPGNDYTLSTSAGRDQYAFYDNSNVGTGVYDNPTVDGVSGELHPWQVGPLTAHLSAAIAVFWADTDTNGTTSTTPGGNSTGSDRVYWDIDAGTQTLTVTWDDVGGFGQASVPNAYQMQLIAGPDGSFDIVFRYESVTWTKGSGYPTNYDAFSGIAGGNESAFYQMPSSGDASSAGALDENAGNTGAVGVWTFHVQDNLITDPSHVANNDAFSTNEAAAIGSSLSVFADNGSGADTDALNPLAVAAVNGSTGDVGTQITLASGALLTLNADGTFDYDPNHAFDALPSTTSGASNTTATDSFTYRLAGGGTATVTITVSGRDSDDTALGTTGNDTIKSGVGDDTVDGLAGNDKLIGVMGADTLDGNDGNDQLSGGLSADILIGGNNDDRLGGSKGADTLIGGSGKDTLKGGPGDDTFVFLDISDSTTTAPDNIKGFTHGDTIDLSAIDADSNTGADDAFVIVASFTGSAGQMVLSVHGNTTTIKLDVTGDGAMDAKIVVDGIVPNAGDFAF